MIIVMRLAAIVTIISGISTIILLFAANIIEDKGNAELG